jgi:nucleotide-binding universal stress UspA family protein
MYRRILVPLDGSPLSEVALDQLPQLVGPETEVLLLRIAESTPAIFPPVALGPFPPGGGMSVGVPPTPSTERLSDSPDEGDDRARREAQEYLDAKAVSVPGPVTRRRTLVLENVDPAAAIAGQGQDERADLIVMSTHGRSGAVRWILGSVAEKVLHSTHIPLLLVRPGKPSE